MEENKTYNGWTNYATWRIKLELLDDSSAFDGVVDADYMEQYVDEVLFDCLNQDDHALDTVVSYARAFLSEVNWDEIAEAINRDNREIEAYEAEEELKGGKD